MRWLWNRTEETVLLAVRDGDQSVIVEKLDSTRPVLATYSLGRLMPLHAVSTGLALLAYHPDDEIREILNSSSLSRYTVHSPTTVDDVWRDIRSTRAKGYSINRELFRDGVSGVAAPVRGRDPRRPASGYRGLCTVEPVRTPSRRALRVRRRCRGSGLGSLHDRPDRNARPETHPTVNQPDDPVPLTGRSGRKGTRAHITGRRRSCQRLTRNPHHPSPAEFIPDQSNRPTPRNVQAMKALCEMVDRDMPQSVAIHRPTSQ